MHTCKKQQDTKINAQFISDMDSKKQHPALFSNANTTNTSASYT